MSDHMDRTLGLGHARGSLILVGCLVAVLVAWRLAEGTLSVSSITSRPAEIFYWTAILFANTRGTALGGYLADSSGLGFLGGACLIGGLIAMVALAYRFTRLDHVALFWAAFVLTRRFGATFGDLLTKPVAKGGLNLGTIGSSVVLAAILIAVVAITSRRARQAEAQPAA